MVDLMGKTRTYWYLFLPFRTKLVSQAVSAALGWIDVKNVYINYQSPTPSDRILFIQCSNNDSAFTSAISRIMVSNNYIKHYAIDREGTTLIEMKFQDEHAWNMFLKGNYSKMYDSDFLLREPLQNKYLRKEVDGRRYYYKPYYVLVHSQGYFENEILPLLSQLSESSINSIKDNEYDQLYGEAEFLLATGQTTGSDD